MYMELKLKNIWIKFGRLIFFIPPAMLLYFLIREDIWNREVCYYAAIAIYGSLSILNLIRVLLFYKREKTIWGDKELLLCTCVCLSCFVDAIFSYISFINSKALYEETLRLIQKR